MNCLAFRFSAMGDVALTVPVLRSMLEQNEDLHLTLVSNKAFEPFFNDLPRFEFYGVDFQQYKGVFGLFKLFNELKSYQKWDCVLDLHSVMRTWVLNRLFKLNKTPVYEIDKGRDDKKALTRKINKELIQLPHTTQRYLNVFQQAGLDCDIEYDRSIHPGKGATFDLNLDTAKKWIGIAPFSKHEQKEWPIRKVKELVEKLSKTKQFEVVLIGGKGKEAEILNKIADPKSNVHSIAGKLTMEEEIALVSKLSLMVSMDSFNMHLAALSGVKVVSIWGATHSFAGFGPVNDNEKYIVEISVKELGCRPCSVFGSKPCYRGDFACMNNISVEMVEEKINFALSN
ncbi:MAG: glycosyltransferase family 9 protein [Cyclobacteriaceae bacterium]|nr:glycosyltransferase family 9 protein [Cyclobacteriaceae bacterium]